MYENLNVSMGDSRDEKGHKRFFPFTPQDHLIPSKIGNYKSFINTEALQDETNPGAKSDVLRLEVVPFVKLT